MKQDLYGGALSCEIPVGFADVSEFRQVPDNQEVFADAATDRCIIVELLELESTVVGPATSEFYFHEIAESNKCMRHDCTILQTFLATEQDLPGLATTAHVTIGKQCVAKFKEASKNTMQLYVCCIRLPTVTTDLVVSVTVPLQLHPSSSSSRDGPTATNADEGLLFLKGILRTLKVHNWGLFQ
ncbi:hypothetical protein H257_04339 [Aphanomyces astaci]|uniref:Ran guanine nucleotide release factor n=1 Tax=Aphanomyces astaci TaxID=112090 RepID=W4GVC0_APHAT|nr:hypothetical protein H257_04339 [Aphanomyces astaci]ETV83660.1 hypothetical protein H257_04339 [Aphanomyces astaci]RQM25134.1 hypothetical protein B5M09_000005 [Aphanomyces astaci]|eukprot:XP_009827090.1 hypothetical protein H257_04339 [Aphanomyces astaci]